MVIDMNEFLQIILYLCLIILVVIFIVLGIRLIKILTKVDLVIDDVNKKMNKVDGLFNIINKTTDYASSISDKVVNAVSGFINSLTKKKKGKDKDE